MTNKVIRYELIPFTAISSHLLVEPKFGDDFHCIEMVQTLTTGEIQRLNQRSGSHNANRGLSPSKLFGESKVKKYVRSNFESGFNDLFERITPGQLSFSSDLNGAKIMIIGPGESATEIIEFIEMFPEVSEVHIVDARAKTFETIDSELKDYQREHGNLRTKIFGYLADAIELPDELSSEIDVVFHSSVFDVTYFGGRQLTNAGEQIQKVLKPGGIDASIWDEEFVERYFDRKIMRRMPRVAGCTFFFKEK